MKNKIFACLLSIAALLSAAVTHAQDFDGDGKRDIFRLDNSGRVGIFLTKPDSAKVGAFHAIDPRWVFIGYGDFDGDGKSDLLWRGPDGNVSVWFMDGERVRQSMQLAPQAPLTLATFPNNQPATDKWNWKLIALADFNGDGKTDILWSDPTGTYFYIWLVGATGVGSTAGNQNAPYYVNAKSDPWAKLVGVADFNADGKADLMWLFPYNVGQPDEALQINVWLGNGLNQMTGGVYGDSVVPYGVEVVAIGDFNGDGTADVLFKGRAIDGSSIPPPAACAWYTDYHTTLHDTYVWFPQKFSWGTVGNLRVGQQVRNWNNFVEFTGKIDGSTRTELIWNGCGSYEYWQYTGDSWNGSYWQSSFQKTAAPIWDGVMAFHSWGYAEPATKSVDYLVQAAASLGVPTQDATLTYNGQTKTRTVTPFNFPPRLTDFLGRGGNVLWTQPASSAATYGFSYPGQSGLLGMPGKPFTSYNHDLLTTTLYQSIPSQITSIDVTCTQGGVTSACAPGSTMSVTVGASQGYFYPSGTTPEGVSTVTVGLVGYDGTAYISNVLAPLTCTYPSPQASAICQATFTAPATTDRYRVVAKVNGPSLKIRTVFLGEMPSAPGPKVQEFAMACDPYCYVDGTTLQGGLRVAAQGMAPQSGGLVTKIALVLGTGVPTTGPLGDTETCTVPANCVVLYERQFSGSDLTQRGHLDYLWSTVPVGTHSLRIRITDATGRVTWSAPQTVQMNGPNNPPTIPTFTLTCLNANLTANPTCQGPATLRLQTTVNDGGPNAGIAKISFIEGAGTPIVDNVGNVSESCTAAGSCVSVQDFTYAASPAVLTASPTFDLVNKLSGPVPTVFTYRVRVTDKMGMVVWSAPQTITILPLPAPTIAQGLAYGFTGSPLPGGKKAKLGQIIGIMHTFPNPHAVPITFGNFTTNLPPGMEMVGTKDGPVGCGPNAKFYSAAPGANILNSPPNVIFGGHNAFTMNSVTIAPGSACQVVIYVRATTLGSKAIGISYYSNVTYPTAQITDYIDIEPGDAVGPTLSAFLSSSNFNAGEAGLTLTLTNPPGGMLTPPGNVTTMTNAEVSISLAPQGFMTALGTPIVSPSGCGGVSAVDGSPLAPEASDIRFSAASLAPGASCTISMQIQTLKTGNVTLSTSSPQGIVNGLAVVGSAVTLSATVSANAAPTISAAPAFTATCAATPCNAPATIQFTAAASDASGGLSEIAFIEGTGTILTDSVGNPYSTCTNGNQNCNLVGKCTYPGSASQTCIVAVDNFSATGVSKTYSFRARVRDSYGRAAWSAPVTVVVQPPQIGLSLAVVDPVQGIITLSGTGIPTGGGLSVFQTVGGNTTTVNCAVTSPTFSCPISGLTGTTDFTVRDTATPNTIRSNSVRFQSGASDAPQADANPSDTGATGTTVGATAGSFDVAESGAAGYSIPIAVTPGTGGVQPSVSLNYSSQGGSGLVGTGWALSGLSTIHRCAKNNFVDGVKSQVTYTNTDVYCLDGQRLVLLSDGSYRTHKDSFSRITQVANGWKVEAKSGLISYYGTDEANVSANLPAGHARWMAVDLNGNAINGGAVRAWALSKVIDRAGNYFLVEYEKPSERSQRPLRIRYTGNANVSLLPYASIEFEYQASAQLSEQAWGYDSGSAVSQITNLLSKIRTTFQGADVRAYALNYDPQMSAGVPRSLLASVQECGWQSGTSLCLPPTTFGWQKLVASDLNFVSGGNPPDPAGQDLTRTGDFNGDGKTDFIRYAGNGAWNIQLGGIGAPQTWSGGGSIARLLLGDFNGDGATDLVSHYMGSQWWVCYSTKSQASGFSCSLQTLATPNDNLSSQFTGDFDGDGRIDIALYMGRNVITTESLWKICLSNGAGFNPCVDVVGPKERQEGQGGSNFVIADFNGDGRADIAGYQANLDWNIGFSTFGGSGAGGLTVKPTTQAIGNVAQKTVVADFNGDGMADLIGFDANDATGWYVCLSKGDGTFEKVGNNNCARWEGRASNNENYVLGDFNGDGRTDIAQYIGNNTWQVCLSTGSSLNCSTTWQAPISANEFFQSHMVGDYNGDGRSDIAINTTPLVSWTLFLANNKYPDLLTSATDGLGKTVTFNYKPLTDTVSGTYTKGNQGIWPLLDIQSPLYVVNSMSTNDGIGGMRSFTYQYQSLVGHANGAGLVGFGTRLITDNLTGLLTTVTTDQSLAAVNGRYGGAPVASSVQANGKYLSKSTSSFQSRLLTGTSNVWQVFPASSTSMSFDPSSPSYNANSGYVSTTTSTTLANIDQYGNVLSTSTSTSDGFSKTTTSSFAANLQPASWLVGRPDSVSVTSVAPGTPSLTRASSFSYYATIPTLVATEIIEPSAVDETKLTTTYGYDGVGNRTTITINGVGLPNNQRTSTTSFSAGAPNYYRFATLASNALNHTATTVYDGRFGVATQVTDPNGVQAVTRYDRLGRKIGGWTSLGGTQTITFGGPAAGAPANTVMSLTTTSTTGSTSVAHVDMLGRELRVDTTAFNGGVASVLTAYDARGLKTSISRPYIGGAGAVSTFSYGNDGLYRLQSETAPDGGITTYAYDGFTSSITRNPGGGQPAQTTTRVINSQGWTGSVTDAAGAVTGFQYDAHGNLRQVSKPGGGTVAMTYDIRGRKKTLTDPDAGTITYTYNAAGEQTAESVSGGRSVTSSYDALGRLATRSEVLGQKTFSLTNTYDCAYSLGKLCQEQYTTPTGTNSRGWQRDNLSRTKQATTTLNVNGNTRVFTGVSYYDLFSRLKQYAYPVTGLTVQQTYNAYGYVDEVREVLASGTKTHWKATARAADGQLQNALIGGNVWSTTRTYDSVGRIKTVNTAGNGTAQQTAQYDYDAVGNLLQRTDTQGGYTDAFTYDVLNRVKTANLTGVGSQTYNYDTLGNLTRPGVTSVYTANTNRLASVNGQALQYDVAGNITGDGARTFEYTPFDLPDRIVQTATGNWMEWSFTGDRQRAAERHGTGASAQGMTYYAAPGHFEQDEVFTGGQWNVAEYRHYLSSPEGTIGYVLYRPDGSTQTLYFLKDHLGSNVAVVTDAGAVQGRSRFTPWGERTQTGTPENSERGFTGHEHLPFSLIHMNGRVYDPLWGRFLQADPIIQEPYNLQSYNRYAYVMNNPLAYTDPTGFSRWTKHRREFWALVAAAIIGPGGVFGTGGLFGSGGLGLLSGTAAQYASAAAAGFAAGGIQGGNLNSALQGAFMSVATLSIVPTTGNFLADTAVNAGVSCATAAAQKGSCGDAAARAVYSVFVSAGVRVAANVAVAYLQTNPAEPRYPTNPAGAGLPDVVNPSIRDNYFSSVRNSDGSITQNIAGPLDYGPSTTREQIGIVVDTINRDWTGSSTSGGSNPQVIHTIMNLTVGYYLSRAEPGRLFFDICPDPCGGNNGHASAVGGGRFYVIASRLATSTSSHEFGHVLGLQHRSYGSNSIMSYDHRLLQFSLNGADPRRVGFGDRLFVQSLYGR